MEYSEIRKKLLNDREFREELMKKYNEDDERFVNKILKKASKN